MKAKPPKEYRWKVFEEPELGMWIVWKNPYCYQRFHSKKAAKKWALRMAWKDYVG